MMTVMAVISADRRYVRLTVIPSFTAITDVQSLLVHQRRPAATRQPGEQPAAAPPAAAA